MSQTQHSLCLLRRIADNTCVLCHTADSSLFLLRRTIETGSACWVKGQTAANSFKPALLDNGVRVSVPPFVGQDEDIVVNTETMEYVERA